jgi:formylglycine-generating enzyme required for sulfatase activity
MHGNLWEWCLDEWQENYNNMLTDGSFRGSIKFQNSDKRVLRGGSWNNTARVCRSANRNFLVASSRYLNIGLRVVCRI